MNREPVASTSRPGPGPEPDHAAQALALCAAQGYGALATLTREPAGQPYGSLVLYALDGRGRPLFLLSRLAEHTANLLADSRASLLVWESAGAANPLSRGRVTLLGQVMPVPDDVVPDARERFLARHPEAQMYLSLPDFAFYRLEVESLRYVGGFGRMSWVGGEDYAAAAGQPW